jgi:hypothetical protein
MIAVPPPAVACDAAVRQLHALDDRMLRDIGVSRSEIEGVVLHGRDALRFHWASQPLAIVATSARH